MTVAGLELSSDFGKRSSSLRRFFLPSFRLALLRADIDRYLKQQPELCASFHQKIFASPIPSSYLPPPPPPIRPSIPSRDQISRTSSLSVRSASASRAPSETSDHSHAHSYSHSSTNQGGLHRSVSRTSDTFNPSGNGNGGQELRRSRSRSIDPVRIPAEPPKRPLIRAPSGKDLFKGREVGLMRRTASRKGQESLSAGGKRDESQSQSQGPSLGLLGRKTSDPKRRRVSNEGESDRLLSAFIVLDKREADSGDRA